MRHILEMMSFLQRYYVFVADKKPDMYAIVQSCIVRDIEQDSILLQHWEKEYIRTLHQSYAPVMHAVPVELFGECVLVVEDNPAVREAIDQKILNQGVHWCYQDKNIGQSNFYQLININIYK